MSISTLIVERGPLPVGVMLIGSGLYGVLRPLNMIRYFGLPWAESSHSKIYPAIGVRNLSAGVAVLALSLTGRHESVGILLASWVFVGVVDTHIVVTDPRGTQRAVHAINVATLSCLSALILCRDKYGTWTETTLMTGLAVALTAMFVNSWILS